MLQKPRAEAITGAYWGPRFNSQQTKDVLDNSKSRYALQTTEGKKLDTTVQLLLAGKIVGWFQGASEFGPRALGNRSVFGLAVGALREGKPERLHQAPGVVSALCYRRSRRRLLTLF